MDTRQKTRKSTRSGKAQNNPNRDGVSGNQKHDTDETVVFPGCAAAPGKQAGNLQHPARCSLTGTERPLQGMPVKECRRVREKFSLTYPLFLSTLLSTRYLPAEEYLVPGSSILTFSGKNLHAGYMHIINTGIGDGGIIMVI